MNEQQFKTYLESQALWRREDEQKRSEKEYLNDLVSNMIKTDGGNLEEFRRWATRVRSNAAILQNNGAAIQLMLRTTLGPLKDEIDRYILEFVNLNVGKSRLDVPCADLLTYLKRSFLPSNDIEHIRESLETFRQSPGESLRVFNRKYRDLAEIAFPMEQRTEDQTKALIRSYLRGLRSKDTARAVLRSCPTQLLDPMTTALDNDEVEEALHRLGHRQEEPMDISAVKPRPPPPMTIDSLSKQLAKMHTKIAKLELQQQGNRFTPRRQKSARTPDGKPICFFCSVPGHIARSCPKKLLGTQLAPMDVSSVPPTAGTNQEKL